jgi:hypothetical protein
LSMHVMACWHALLSALCDCAHTLFAVFCRARSWQQLRRLTDES